MGEGEGFGGGFGVCEKSVSHIDSWEAWGGAMRTLVVSKKSRGGTEWSWHGAASRGVQAPCKVSAAERDVGCSRDGKQAGMRMASSHE